MNTRALVTTTLLLTLLAACGKKPDTHQQATSAAASASSPKPLASALQSASAKAPAPALTASASATAIPTATASSSADAEEEVPKGAVHIHLDSVKVTSGKSEGAEKTLKVNMLKLRNACIAPAIKKTPSFEGTLKVALDVGEDGKIKASPTVATGKLPADIAPCVGKFYEEKVQLQPSKPKLEATILMGPKVAVDK